MTPKTVRNVYGVLRTMFHDAQVEELIETSPCVLKRDDLPRKVDKNPTWRPTAIFTREEIQQLIEDGRIPQRSSRLLTPSWRSAGCDSAKRRR